MTEVRPDALSRIDFDQNVRPQDDLFRHVNGRWLAEATIPDDKPGIGAFVELRDQAEEAVRDIITGLAAETDGSGSDSAERTKIADLYASFMDIDTIEAKGLDPLRAELAAIDEVDSAAALTRLLGRLTRLGARSLWGLDADSDPGDPSQMVMFIGQSGLGLPDEEYYRAPEFSEIRTEYVAHVERTFALAGWADDAAEGARLLFELEERIAARHWDKVRTRDMQQMYNPMTFAEFTGSTQIPWAEYLAGAEIPAEALGTVINAQPSFFTEVSQLVTEYDLQAWRWWARYTLLSSFSAYLSEEFVAERFSFYGTVLSGMPANRDRWKRGVSLVEGALGEAVGKIYVERHFPPAAKARIDALVANLLEAYRRSITDLAWMGADTKQEALKKLAAFRPKIAYPEHWRDYSSLEISRDDLVGNVIAANRFELNRSIAKVGKPVDPDEWFMTPQTVNAYYHPLRNEIVFPAAILQPPFFDAEADDAVNYGGIGAVIGHEIGHGFDDQGSRCDGEGRLRDWWTAADRAAFEERTSSLIGQYDALSPEGADGQHVNGKLTIGENIGDLGGLAIAYLAWQIATEGREVPEIDGQTGQQRLFLNWALVWQAKFRPETVKQRLATDPHSPNEFRCNQIVRNLDGFYQAFAVTETDRLWLPAADRVVIWG
ncbi:M13 family metallopeptidase [Granulicoccus phenolivorans]|uniref:M13 family metallopeptidase n=1 Tax=Granulicoccus phenolivorans TaxID=266854 RepID=UPI00041F9F43|nr:M13-type metalloendopeptidase [Granulicoccus phenolivorans]